MASKKKTSVDTATGVNVNDYINQLYMGMDKQDKADFNKKVEELENKSKQALKDELFVMANGAPKVEEEPVEKPKRKRKKAEEVSSSKEGDETSSDDKVEDKGEEK